MALDGQRVVEKDHHAITGEVLQRPLMFDDELAHGAVIIAQHAKDLLRLGGLGKTSEAAQIAEGHGDLAAMALEHLRALLARDQRRDLRREKARQFRALALHRLKEIDVRDRDRSLVCERADELNLIVAERADLQPDKRHDPQHLVVADQGNHQERFGGAEAREIRGAAAYTPVVVDEIGDLYGSPLDVRAPDEGIGPDRDRAVIEDLLDRVRAALRLHGEHV